ncbi:MAG: Ger(x)C family spore germination C-terminal domain-containing protein [Clostridium sp.]|nr:Ger(x)C family spore germination C-terminal domain-containing protein [Clostridium sp.]
MAKINKIFKVIISFLIPLTLSGCFNYRDINKVTFATSIIFDTDDFGQVVVYLDCIKPYRSTNESSDKGRRLIFKGIGKTTEDALEQIDNISSSKINYSQVKAYLFTEKAAKKGVKKYLDLINNYGEMQIKPSAFIYYGDVEELIKTTSSDEEFLGMYLDDIINKKTFNDFSLQSNVNYYLSNRLMGDNTLMLPAVRLKKDVIDNKIQIDGSGILKDNILVDKLDEEDTLIYQLIMGSVYGGTFEIGNPNTESDFISLDILSSSENSNLIFSDNKLTLVKNIEVELEISDIQGEAIVDSNFINYIKANEEAYITNSISQLFNNYKEKGIDIFNVHRMKEIHYTKEEIDNPLSICDIEINVKVNINGTGLSKNAL